MKASLLLVALAVPMASHDFITTNLTYTREISRILDHRCAACHGESSTLPLTSYEQVRPWATGIKEQVLARSMPPWGAVKGFGQFDPDEGLNQEEILMIAAWATGGAPQGDQALLAQASPVRPPADAGSAVEPPMASVAIATPAVLKKGIKLVGLHPLDAVVASARITAVLPDGRIEPLLWLLNYEGRNRRSFRLRHALELPAGTWVRSTAAVRLELKSALQTSARVSAREP